MEEINEPLKFLECNRCGYEDLVDNFPLNKKESYKYCPFCNSTDLGEFETN